LSEPIIQLEDVHLTLTSRAGPVHILRGVSLTIPRGQSAAIVGPSGSGKTSLLMVMAGLERATRGDVTVGGRPLNHLTEDDLAVFRGTEMGIVFQSFHLVPTMTALENVALPLELDGTSARKAHRQAADALRQVGIPELADRFMDQMSGGQQQRVAIARAIVGNRRLILADEPTGALDSTTGHGVMEVLRARADAGAAVMLVTHEARHAAWADRVVFLRDGRIIDQAAAMHDPTMLLTQAGL
jgi:putative ABC transport system ATP-binding protein